MRCLFEEATQKRDALERSVAAFPTTTPLDVLVRRDHVGLRSLFLAYFMSLNGVVQTSSYNQVLPQIIYCPWWGEAVESCQEIAHGILNECNAKLAMDSEQ